VHHLFPSSNYPLHEHILSFLRARLFLFRGRVILCPSGWPPSDHSNRIAHIAREVYRLISAACIFLVHHVFPSSVPPCPLASRASHGGRLMLPRHDLSRRIPVLASVMADARGRRPRVSVLLFSLVKASKATRSMVYHVGRAPEHGARQGIE